MKHFLTFAFIIYNFFAFIIPVHAVDPYIVSPLPVDNLISNPWFNANGSPSFVGWTDATTGGKWTLSPKEGTPTPDISISTSARVSTGRGDDETGKSTEIGVDNYLFQIVSADPTKTTLLFDMYWVTHTLNPGEVNIYGSNSNNGPWTFVWKPFYQVFTKQIIPGSGRGQDLWEYYSNLTNQVSTTISQGYPFYKVEVHANLPDENGGFKITGIYFAVTDGSGIVSNINPTASPTIKAATAVPSTTSTPSDVLTQNQNNIWYLIMFLIIILIALLIVKKYFSKPSTLPKTEVKQQESETSSTTPQS